MKRFFILASAAIVALASCSKTQVVYNDAPEEIGFKAVTDAMTKAPLSGTELPTNQGDMMVYASQSATSGGTYEPSFGAEFTWKTSYWGGKDNPQYWPNSGYMMFMAYYPTGIGTPSGNAKDGVIIPDINIETSQTDILYANLTEPQTCADKPTVNMTFMHALAQIQVTAAVANNAMDNVKITKVEIVTPNMGGELTLTGAAASWDDEVPMGENYPMDNVIASTPLTTSPVSLGTGALVVPGDQTGLKITYSVAGLEKTIEKSLAATDVVWAQAKKYIFSYLSGFPKVKEYLDNVKAEAKQDGYVTTLFGRRRKIAELASSNKNLQHFGERVAMNSPIQGTAADIIKIAMIKVTEALEKENIDARLILQVHDELILEAHKDFADRAYEILKESMENAIKLSVPLDVDAHIGNNWLEAK